MLRKTLMALGAVAVLGAAALAPTSASAGGFGFKHKHFPPHFGYGWGYPVYQDCYWVKKYTHFGVKFVKICTW
jgi:hypothetical protein